MLSHLKKYPKHATKGEKMLDIELRSGEEELHQLDGVVPDQVADQALADPPAKESR